MSEAIGSKFASAQDLFQVRKAAKKLPRAVGTKGYDPGEQPHLAELEQQYLRQRTCLLKEPRFVQNKQLYHGEWIEERKLIRVNEVGEFWTFVGFSDREGKWLYPEEALFLMETNTLEVRLHGCRLSQQEALQLCLASGGLTLEEYTVYCTLRRNSYLVMRFHRDPNLSFYAQSIGLDQYINRAKRPRQEKHFKSAVAKTSSGTDQTTESVESSKTQVSYGTDGSFESSGASQEMDTSCQKNPVEVSHAESGVDRMDVGDPEERAQALWDRISEKSDGDESRNHSSGQVETDKKGGTVEVCDGTDPNQSDKLWEQSQTEMDTTEFPQTGMADHLSQDSPAMEQSSAGLHQNSEDVFSRIVSAWGNCFTPDAAKGARVESVASAMSGLDPSQVFIPNIAGKLAVALHIPKASLLPPGVEVNEELQDVCLYSRPEEGGSLPAPEDVSSVQNLRFSYAEWTSKRKVPRVQAQNWREYKEKMAEVERNSTVHESPAAHLWQGEITPLVHPSEATCLDTVFDKLKVKTFDLHKWISESGKSEHQSSVKISFNVYAPNAEFRKSQPGRPDHRVVVRRITERFPSVWERAEAARLSADGVPVHWAFLDCGSVSFFRINSTSLPSVF